MPSANKTENYELNQWQGNEYPKREDFNSDNFIIDTQLKNVNDKAEGKISKSLATAASQFLVSSAAGQWAIKTIAEIKSLLGLGSASEKDFSTSGGVAAYDTVSSHLSDYVRNPGYGVTAGSANVYTVTLNPAPTAYIDGMGIAIKVHAANTGASTINPNGLGAKSIVDSKGNALAAGKLRLNGTYSLKYNSTSGNFILQGEGGEYGTAGAAQVLSGYTVGTDDGLIQGSVPIKTPDILNQINAINAIAGVNSGDSNNCAYLQFTDVDKFFQGARWVRSIQPDLLASNITKDKNIFGVVGTFEGKGWYKSTGSPSYYGAFMWDNGEIPYAYGLEVSLNLSFTPKTIIIWRNAIPSLHTLYSSEFEIMTATGYQAIYNPYVSHRYVVDGTYAYLRSSGFRMPVTENNEQYTFIIFG